MHSILLKLGPFTIYSYGVMVALGFGIAAFLIYRRAPAFGLDKDKVIDLVIVALVSGIIGARLLYVILNLKYYLVLPAQILNLSKGGLVWYGGFFSAFLAVIVYLRANKLNFWLICDLMAPYISLAQGLGRIGCFLNGCCYGLAANAGYPLAVLFPGEHVFRHPAQLYSALALFTIFIILRIWQEKRHFLGEIFLGYCILYSLKRFLLEFLRGDNAGMIYGLTLSQGISVVMLLVSAFAFMARARSWKNRTSNSR